MATIEEFILKFKTQGTEAITAATNSIKGLGQQISGLAASGGGLEGILGGIAGKMGPIAVGGLAAGAAFASAAMKAINLADALGDISDATGINAGALNNLKNSLVLAGGKADDFATLASRLNKNVGEAALGNETLQKTFKTLGVYVTDANGNLRDTGDILRDSIRKIAAIEDPAIRAKLAVELFGKEAAKLDFTKLNAANDFAKDEQIAQLAKYRDAIDNIAVAASDRLLTVFGTLAVKLDSEMKKAESINERAAKMRAQAEADLNAQGRTGDIEILTNRGKPGTGITLRPGGGISFQMSPEQAALKAKQKADADRIAEQNKLMAGYTTRAETTTGGFGALGPSMIASNKAIAQAQVEAQRFAALAGQDAMTAEALKGANDRMAIDIKANNDIKNLQINLAQDIKKMTADVRANEKIDAGQQNAEIAAKTTELQGKAALEVQKVKEKAAKDAADYTMKMNAKVYSEEEAQRQASAEALIAQQKQFEGAAKTARDRADAYARGVMELEDQILLEKTLLGMNSNQASMYRQIAEEVKKRTDAIRELADVENLTYEDRLAQEARIREESAKAIDLIKKRSADDLARSQDLTAGLTDAWAAYKENALNTADQIKSGFNSSLSSIEDAFVKLVTGGKLSFSDLANSILADLARIAFKKAVVGLGSLFGFATGGQVMADTPIMVGERGPELFVPRSAGTIVPHNALSTAGASSSGGSTMVTYNIQAVDAASFRSLVARDPSFIYAVTEQGRRSQPSRSR
jgi:lambda family phage tail tape measure protein